MVVRTDESKVEMIFCLGGSPVNSAALASLANCIVFTM